MTPSRTIGQTPPDQANELLAQILDTSNEAVELREQLLAALSQELELLASLQEQHLFPVLEQNPETADLGRRARDDYQQTRVLLNELAAIPKDSDAFLAEVAELRKVFQQHIRNDKNELLPVVLKVLSEEEVEAVVEKVEEEVAETRQAARELRRTRRGRKQAEATWIQAGPCWLPSRLDLTASGSSSRRCRRLLRTVPGLHPRWAAARWKIRPSRPGSTDPVGSDSGLRSGDGPIQSDPGRWRRNHHAGMVRVTPGAPAEAP